MESRKSDRRVSPRVPVRVPVKVRATENAGEVSATTRDLSSNGVFLYADSALREGSQIEMVLILPPELAGGARRWACCQASVLRVENESESGFGVAAAIDQIELLPEIKA